MQGPEEDDALKALGVKDAIQNETLLANMKRIVERSKTLLNGGQIGRDMGKLLYQVASKCKGSDDGRDLLVDYICGGKIRNESQLSAALQYLKRHPMGPIDIKDFEEACGVGVVITFERIVEEVRSAIKGLEKSSLKNGDKFKEQELYYAVRKQLKWADSKQVENAVNTELSTLLGAKDIPKEGKTKAISSQAPTEQSSNPWAAYLVGEARNFHRPGENYLTDGYVVTPHTSDLLRKHLEETGGKVITRFPPEPNGILHIGHAKAINFNFGYAKALGGITYLRYDDTNPETEDERYIREIKEMVEWLGHKPYKITFASDYFPQLYNYAVQLIKRGHAYVCHQGFEELKGIKPPASPWRDRPVEESLKLFEDMKEGKFKEGYATLRMKMTMEDGKQDPVAYRIKYTPHPQTGTCWCIYPTYDYAHCLCDSIENITHSLCTKEFQSRRSSYYWLCNALDLYCPVQWEYSRLNVSYTLVSKRKIQKLISAGLVQDWDDPRLYTLSALRRRGYPPDAINRFCLEAGVTVSEGAVQPEMLEHYVREELNRTAQRVMAVLRPLKVTLINFPHPEAVSIPVPNHPKKPSAGIRNVPLDRVIYIERSDFLENPDTAAGYHRLTPRQRVGLNHTSLVIGVEEIVKDSTGNISELIVRCEKLSDVGKPKAFIHWVSNPLSCTVRMYNRLFHHKDPEDLVEGFISDINPHSMEVIEGGLVERSFQNIHVGTVVQFERLGYFCVDRDTDRQQHKLVFNRTVSLREDSNNPVPV